MDMHRNGRLLKTTLLSLSLMASLTTFSMASECIGCLEDCSKVLVSNKVVKIRVPEIVKPKPDAVKVSARVETEDPIYDFIVGMVSPVKCEVKEENEVSIITCGF